MTLYYFKHSSTAIDDCNKEYTPELITHQNQLYDESEGGEFLDDSIRAHEQLLNTEEHKDDM